MSKSKSKTKNKFDKYPITYQGNKYLETKKYLSNINIKDYDIIAEPFGGIFGFCRAMFELNSNWNGKIYINDIDRDLINFHNKIMTEKGRDELYDKYNPIYEDFKDGHDRELTEYIKKSNDPVLKFMARATISTLYRLKNFKSKLNSLKTMSSNYNPLIERLEFFNMNYIDFIDMLNKQDKKILIYHDPPYFSSDNSAYYKLLNDTKNNPSICGKYNKITDNTGFYVDIYEIMKRTPENIDHICILNKCAILEYIFKPFKIGEYEKVYQSVIYHKRNQTQHVIYSTNSYLLS